MREGLNQEQETELIRGHFPNSDPPWSVIEVTAAPNPKVTIVPPKSLESKVFPPTLEKCQHVTVGNYL